VTSIYDCSGSSHWYNKTDTAIVVNRDVEKGFTEFRVAKVREIDVMGNIGEFQLVWNPSTRCFEDVHKQTIDL
jgi:hypothetical protein